MQYTVHKYHGHAINIYEFISQQLNKMFYKRVRVYIYIIDYHIYVVCCIQHTEYSMKITGRGELLSA